MFHSQSRSPNCISLILLLLVANSHSKIVDEIGDSRKLTDLQIRRKKTLVDKLPHIRETTLKLSSSIVLELVSLLSYVCYVAWPDVLANLTQLVNPVSN